MIDELLSQIERHESYRSKPYKDTVGKLTVAIGRNLEDVGIRHDEARYMLNNDVQQAVSDLKANFPAFNSLDDVRKAVLINMCFNMGWHTLSLFKQMLAYVAQNDFDKASAEMLDSLWARQVGDRAKELAAQLKTGEWQKP